MAFATPAIATALRLVAFAALAVSGGAAIAQAFPEKPVRFIVNFPPGGPLDIVGRSLGDKMSAALKQPVLVENRPGAGGNIGAEAVARAAPDGHTVLLSLDTLFTVNPHLYANTGFKVADLKPVIAVATAPQAIAVNPSVGVGTLADLVAKGKREPIAFSSGGNGSPGHLAVAILQDATGIKVNHVPYKGNTAAVLALVTGEVQSGILATPGLMPHVQSGKVRLLAVTGRKRSPLAPDVPSTAEAGLPAMLIEVMYLASVPAATPEAPVKVLQKAIADALATPDVRQRLTNLDLVIDGATGASIGDYLARTSERYARVIKSTGMKID